MIDEIKLEKLARMLQQAMDTGFTGNIQINFSNGGITNINRLESIKI